MADPARDIVGYRAAGAGRAATGGRFCELTDEALDRYADSLSRLVLKGRLNKFYPDPFAAADRIRFLGASLRKGVYGGAQIDRKSGMPHLRDVMTVQADRRIAEDFLRQHEARLAAGRSVTERVRAKLEYYRKLVGASLPPLHSLSVLLRRVYPERDAAAFQVVYDNYDASEGVFTRYTVLLEQNDGIWGDRLLERSGDYTRQTAAFRERIEKLAQDESEILFLLLGKAPAIRIEEVTRGRIGPAWTPWTPGPEGWFPRGDPEAFVLHCPLDQASVGTEADSDQDPFASLYKDFLSDVSRPLIQEAADRLGYRVRKERKFACTKAAETALRAKLREAGTQNVVYTL